MPETVDYLIIGGGIVGTSIAYHLAASGNDKVVLCERRGLSTGTSAFSGAMCGQQPGLTDTISKLAVRALDIYENFGDRVGGDCGFINNGLLITHDSRERAEKQAADSRKNGSVAEVLKGEDIPGVSPEMNVDGVEAAVFFPKTGCVDSFKTVHAYGAAARKHGAEIREFTGVQRLEVNQGRVEKVILDNGVIHPGKVILACGPWSLKLAMAAGIKLPYENTQVGVCFFRQPPGFHEKPPVTWVRDIGGIIPWHGGNFRVLCDDRNPRMTMDPDPVEGTCPNWVVDKCGQSIRHHFPKMQRGIFQGGYRTCYDETPDLCPLLGFIPGAENLFLNCGWSGKGFKFSVALGEYLGQWIREEACPLDLHPWLAERFQVSVA